MDKWPIFNIKYFDRFNQINARCRHPIGTNRACLYIGHPYNACMVNSDWRRLTGELLVLFLEINALTDNNVLIQAMRKPLLSIHALSVLLTMMMCPFDQLYFKIVSALSFIFGVVVFLQHCLLYLESHLIQCTHTG